MLPVLPYQECELAQWKTDKQLTLRSLCHSSIDFIYLPNTSMTLHWEREWKTDKTAWDSASEADAAATLSLQIDFICFLPDISSVLAYMIYHFNFICFLPDICSLSAQVWCLLAHLKYVCCLITNISSAATVRKTDKQGGVGFSVFLVLILILLFCVLNICSIFAQPVWKTDKQGSVFITALPSGLMSALSHSFCCFV